MLSVLVHFIVKEDHMKKRIIAFSVSVVMMMTILAPLSVQAETYQQYADRATEICEAINMVVGTGSGLTPDYLASTPKRYGGAKLIVALRGLLSTAQSYPYTQNFTDYLDLAWVEGQHILGYLKEHPAIGYNGKPDGSFAPNDNMSVKEYYKLMLVSLGYVENVDFSWSGSATMPDVMEMATSVGLVWLDEGDAFTMEKLCVATLEALETNRNGSSETLASWLVDQGAILEATAILYGLMDPVAVDPVPTAAATGYLNYEIAVVNGETVISVLLTNGLFVTNLGDNNANTQAFIDGLDGNLDTVVSFDSAVSLDYSAITRLSGSLVTITIPASPNYRIAEDETVTLTIDPSLIQQMPDDPVVTTFTISDVGAGTIDDPWQLYRLEDMYMMNVESEAYYEMKTSFPPTGVIANGPIVNRFGGKLNGNGNKIQNLVIEWDPAEAFDPAAGVGVFGVVTEDAEIVDVGFEGVDIRGGGADHGGVACGTDEGGTWSGVRVSGSTIDDVGQAGGLIGHSTGDTSLTTCSVETSSYGDTSQHVGGFIGTVEAGATVNIDSCTTDDLTLTGQYTVGGVVGYNQGQLTITNTNTRGDYTGQFLFLNYSAKTGGVVGQSTNSAVIRDSSAYGTLSGYYYMGGIMGQNTGNAVIEDNHSGISTFTYSFFIVDDPSTAHIHRVLGNNTGTMTLDNTANISAVLVRAADGTETTPWVSDAADLDGANFIFILPLDVFIIPELTPIVPEGPILDPDIWQQLPPIWP